jgi:hypothetical protein
MKPPPLTASGMIYRSGYFTSDSFMQKCGVNPLEFPEYFRITSTGLVVCLPAFRDACETIFHQSERMFAMICERQFTEMRT